MIKKIAFLMLLCLSVVSAANASQTFRNVYSSTAVTTGTPLSVLSSSAAIVSEVEIFDSSGQTMKLIVNSATALLIPPGGGHFKLGISSGAVVELEAVSATANAGEIDINFL